MHHSTDRDELIATCQSATTFEHLSLIGIREAQKFAPIGADMVCGPITTGGRGTRHANMEIFTACICLLQERDTPVFDQRPYEHRIKALSDRWRAENGGDDAYCHPILTGFYHPVFQTGHIRRAQFIPGWESSTGATWEREVLTELGVTIVDLTSEDVAYALTRHA